MAFTANDILLDHPENSFCRIDGNVDTSNTRSGEIEEAGCRMPVPAYSSGNYLTQALTFPVPSSGKWFIEAYAKEIAGSGNAASIGIVNNNIYPYWSNSPSFNYSNAVYKFSILAALSGDYMVGFVAGASTTQIAGRTGSYHIAYLIDVDNSKLYGAYDNGSGWTFFSGTSGTISSSTNLASVTGVPYTREHGDIILAMNAASGNNANKSILHFNFGDDPGYGPENITKGGHTDANGHGNFRYALPSGYLALCTDNLPEPTISPNTDHPPNQQFHSRNYQGTTADQTLAGFGFRPDWLMFKQRNGTSDRAIFDSLRGVNSGLTTSGSSTAAANTAANDQQDLEAFLDDGLRMGTASQYGSVNSNGHYNQVWAWKAGGNPSATNSGGQNPTSGSVMIDGVASTAALPSSTIYPTKMSVNTKAGFSIVQYTGNGTNNADITIPHGLGVVPAMIWVKNIGRGSTRWQIWHHKLSTDSTYETKNLIMSSSIEDAYSSQLRIPTANHIEVRDGNSDGNAFVNRNGDSYIAYVFAQVEGYSSYGRYTGGAANDTKIYLDFKPSIIGFKRVVGGATNWYTFDRNITDQSSNTSGPHNVDTHWQPLELTDAFTDGGTTEICANGFRHMFSSSDVHSDNHQYIYYAFAGHMPFKYATGGS